LGGAACRTARPRGRTRQTHRRSAGRGGYTDELEFTRSLLTNPETQKRVTAFLAGAAEPSTPAKSGAAR